MYVANAFDNDRIYTTNLYLVMKQFKDKLFI